jgi:hypothetical protein
MLDLVAHAQSTAGSPQQRVQHIFPICTHIPAPFTASKVMESMCTMPEALFNGLTKMDSSLADTWVEKVWLKMVGSKKADRDVESRFVDSRTLRETLAAYKPDEEQIRMSKERSRIDYRLGYTRIPGISGDSLTKYYTDCPLGNVGVTWFTCDADIFFGPASVQRITEEMKNAVVEMVVVDEASHADIYMRTQVWEMIYQRITKVESTTK